MNILVTGVAGAIGSHVAEALVAAGHRVIGVDSFNNYYDPEIKRITAADLQMQGIEVLDVDLNTADLDALLADIDVIYHFAAQPGLSAHTPFSDYVEQNIFATNHLLEAAKRKQDLHLFVHASTSSVYGSHASSAEHEETRPTSYYGVTKLAAEQLALAAHRTHKLPVVVLRLFSVYGPRERPEKLYHMVIRNAEAGKPITLYKGAESHVRSYTYIDDIVRGCLLALEHREKAIGHAINLGSDRAVTTGEGLRIIESALGIPLVYEYLPPRHGDQLETAANIQKARELLGYTVTTQLEEGLANEVAWYREKIKGRVPRS